MNEINITSPAKINLFLEVLGKREDGYWEIETVLQEIDLHDEIIIKNNESGKICVECSLPFVEEKSNLAYKAARLIQERTGLPFPRGSVLWTKGAVLTCCPR